MKTIEIIEQSKTEDLRELLKKYERVSELNELLIDKYKENNNNFEELNKENMDYEIDIVLIRRELNKRLWHND